MSRLSEWASKKTTNPIKEAYNKQKNFWKNCEDIGLAKQAERKLRREQARNNRRLARLRKEKSDDE
jgi:hypothetical protein